MEQRALFAAEVLRPTPNPGALTVLREAALVCGGCELSRNRTNVVFGNGNSLNPLVTFVGEAPGATEDMCLVPETPVLMEDLRWKSLGDTCIGDRILTLEEEPSKSHPGISGKAMRLWVIATVTAKISRLAETVRVVSEQGELIGSGDHRMLNSNRHAAWIRLDKVSSGTTRATHLVSVGRPWIEDSSREAGWLAGFLDGEGSIGGSKGGSKTGALGMTQNKGSTLSRALAVAASLGFQFRAPEEQRKNGVTCCHCYLRGGQLEVLRCLGRIRPERLISDFIRVLPNIHILGQVPSKVLCRESSGIREVVDITTTSGTFIANGMLAHNCGQPFVGRAGQLLDKMIIAMKLDRSSVYIANSVCCRPPQNRKPEPPELLACSRFLFGQLRATRPHVIVALGLTAAQALLKTKKMLGELRGKWHEWESTPLRVTYHPAAVLRDASLKAPVWLDLQEVLKKLDLEVSSAPS